MMSSSEAKETDEIWVGYVESELSKKMATMKNWTPPMRVVDNIYTLAH